MAIYKLQHCYSLLSSPAEKLVCARLMQWRHRAEGDRRGKGCHGCHMNNSALTARLKRFLVVPVSPDRKNDDEPQSLRSMQIRRCNGFNFATIFTGRPKFLVLLAILVSSATSGKEGDLTRDSACEEEGGQLNNPSATNWAGLAPGWQGSNKPVAAPDRVRCAKL